MKEFLENGGIKGAEIIKGLTPAEVLASKEAMVCVLAVISKLQLLAVEQSRPEAPLAALARTILPGTH